VVSNSRFLSSVRSRGRIAPAIIITVFVASSILYLDKSRVYIRNQKKFINKVEDIVLEYRGDVIYSTHWLWNSRVGFFMDYVDDYFPSGYHPYRAFDPGKADPASKNLYFQLIDGGEILKSGILLFDLGLFDVSRGKIQGSNMLNRGDIPLYLENFLSSKEIVSEINMGRGRRLKIFRIEESEMRIPAWKRMGANL
jgi:hypothetical protein